MRMDNIIGRKNTIAWRPDESVLPMRCIQRGSLVGGILITLFALAWCGFLIACIIMGTIKEGMNIPMSLLLMLFALPGFLFFYAGLALLFNRREIFITRESVSVQDRGLKKAGWTEPLEAYVGVLKRTIRTEGKGGASSIEHLIVLAHEQVDKEITLFQSYSSMPLQDSWRRFGALLDMPLLEETEEGIVVAEEYTGARKIQRPEGAREERPLRDLAESLQKIGPQVTCHRDGDAFVLSYPHYWESWKAGLGLALVVAMLLFAGALRGSMPEETGLTVFFWVMYGFLGIMLLALWSSLRAHEELRIDSTRITHWKRSGRKEEQKAVRVDSIHSIRVKRDTQYPQGWQSYVVIQGAEESILFAGGLTRDKKIQLKEAILAALMQLHPRAGVWDGAEGSASVLPSRFAASPRLLGKLAFIVLIFFGSMAVLMHFAFDGRKPMSPDREPARQATGTDGDTSRDPAVRDRSHVAEEQKRLALKRKLAVERLREDREKAKEARKEALKAAGNSIISSEAATESSPGPSLRVDGGNRHAGYGESKSVRVSLSANFAPVKEVHLGGWSPFTDPLWKERPDDIVAEPPFQSTERLYGALKLGEGEHRAYLFIIDRANQPHSVLYIDINQNGDLTDDGDPLRNQGSVLFATEVLLPMNRLVEGTSTREQFSVWLFVNDASLKKGFASHYSKTKMKGKVLIEGREYLAYIAEIGRNDADFTNDGIYVDLNSDGKIDRRAEYIRRGRPAIIEGKKYVFDIDW